MTVYCNFCGSFDLVKEGERISCRGCGSVFVSDYQFGNKTRRNGYL